MKFTEDQIIAFAPDEASKKSGKDLANLSKWVSKGFNEQALWGECQGSGSKPYQTQIDITDIAFKCSCPSRKFPCKHGLGLLFLYARHESEFTQTMPPAWVTDWLNKRTGKQEKKESKEEKPVDEAAQAKRGQARNQKVKDGTEELRLWLKDIIRNGILNIPEKKSAWFENMAKRMVDAQAPGIANMIRNLGDINLYEDGWQKLFVEQLAVIYLIIEGFKNIDNLPAALQQDIRTSVGFTQSQEELKEQQGTTDTWMVLAKQTSETDNITTEKYWLYGTKTNRYALILQFLVRGQGGQVTLTPGMFMQAELVFFPAVSPLRAIIKSQAGIASVSTLNGFTGWQQVAETETQLAGAMPVRSERPFIIHGLIPVNHNNQWWLKDAYNNIFKIRNEHKMIWKLLSLSGGEALDMVVIGKEDKYEPVGVWYRNEYKIL